MDGTDSGSFPVACFGISSVKSLGSTTTVLVMGDIGLEKRKSTGRIFCKNPNRWRVLSE
jgi:hypothetical protein